RAPDRAGRDRRRRSGAGQRAHAGAPGRCQERDRAPGRHRRGRPALRVVQDSGIRQHLHRTMTYPPTGEKEGTAIMRMGTGKSADHVPKSMIGRVGVALVATMLVLAACGEDGGGGGGTTDNLKLYNDKGA